VMGTFIYGESFDVVQVVGACLTVGGIYLGVTRNAEA
jgi:drug/metabolite transporter (DMT)-like permease